MDNKGTAGWIMDWNIIEIAGSENYNGTFIKKSRVYAYVVWGVLGGLVVGMICGVVCL